MPSHPGSRPTSPVRRLLLRAEARLERWNDGRRSRRGSVRPVAISAHAGYAHPSGAEVLARVMEEAAPWNPTETDTRLANIKGIGALFATHEIAHAPLFVRGWDGSEVRLSADAEGYVEVSLPPADPISETRWDALAAVLLDEEGAPVPKSETELPVLRVGTSARFAVVSDVDDTVMETGAENLARNLWTTFTGNPLTRHVYEHVPALYRDLAHHGGVRTNPIFYLSSSPWNLYGMIRDVFERNGVPWGPIFLRDFGLDEAKFIKGTHGGHKLGHGRTLMRNLDGLPFLFIGDLGQADAEIYAELARERPGQMMGVILHQPSHLAHDAKRRHVEEMEGLGIPVIVTRDYAEVREFARSHGWTDGDGTA